ncbi:MAG: response regulator [Dokdonella sp.]|uniref:response regulator transcription factor n=1 Tax=Dokdonella sp. TaxID=2291710 RepID=UPI00326456DD
MHALLAHEAPDDRKPVVLVVDDEPLMLTALGRLFECAGLAVELYRSGADFFEKARFDRPGCIVLDVRMPEMSGIEVQALLGERNVQLPVIFLTGTSEVHIAVEAMREGAADFIEKPFEPDHLLARVHAMIVRDAARRHDSGERNDVLRRIKLLTPRELSVMALVVAGNTSKQIARTLGGSHRTVDIHRHHLMEKMNAVSVADLVRMGLLASETPVPAPSRRHTAGQ